jgi:hypothetical protein
VCRLGLYAKRDGAKSCWYRPGAGEGETEINRLFYRLGWTKGWYKGQLKNKRFGEIAGDHAAPDWKAIKKKLLLSVIKKD